VLARLPILGVLARQEAAHIQWLRRIDRVHPHITLNHLTVAYALAAPFTFALWISSGAAVFDHVTLSLLVVGLIAATLGFSTGLLSWIVNYESKASRVFNLKIANGMLLLVVLLAALAWRLTGPDLVLSRPGCYLYLAALLVQGCLALVLDFNGKKIVYA